MLEPAFRQQEHPDIPAMTIFKSFPVIIVLETKRGKNGKMRNVEYSIRPAGSSRWLAYPTNEKPMRSLFDFLIFRKAGTE